MSKMKSYLRILSSYKLLGKSFWWFVVTGVLAHCIILFLPILGQRIIHTIDSTKNMHDFVFNLVLLGVSALLFVVFNRINAVLNAHWWGRLLGLKMDAYRKKILEMNHKNVQKVGTGKGISKLEQGVHAETDIFESMMQILIHGVLKGSALIVIIGMLEPVVLLVIVISLVIIVSTNMLFYKKLEPFTKKMHAIYEQSGRDTVRLIGEHLLIKMANKQAHELKKCKQNLDQLPNVEARTSIYQYSFYDIISLMIRVCEVVIYAIVGMMVLKGDAPISYLILLTGYLWTLWWPIESTVFHLGLINRHWVKYQKLQEFVNMPNDVVDGEQQFAFSQGEIRFEKVSFGYNGDPEGNIKDCTLQIPAKQMTAFVGASGSGKSTLIKLLLRSHDVSKGKILIDGQDIRTLKLADVYEHISYISQEHSIFDGTVRENLMHAIRNHECLTDADLWKALEYAQAKEFVQQMKHGLDTEIGERGVFVSGGERQRLALTRVFLKNPQILILDEPTSALDSKSEHEVTKVLNEVMKNRTVIVVAHRLQTIRQADHICVLDKGQIVEKGNYQELLQHNGMFAELVKLQNGIY